nr:hypothetical protein [Methanobrevibacter arboriphilus]
MQKLKSNANSTSSGINNSFSKTGSNIGQSISKGTGTAQANINKLNSAVNNFNNQAGLGFNRTGNTIGQSISKGSSTGTSALSKLSSIGNSIFSTISSGASKAGTTIGNGLSKGASIGTQALSKLGSVGKSAVSGIASQFEGLNGVIAGAIGGFGLYEIGQAAWTGATQKQFNQAYLATKMSDSAAKGYVKTINDIVAKVPGDDTFMSTLLSGAVARQTNLSTDQLVTLGNAVADYTITSQAMGKSMIETQMDLKEYVQTGNTSQLERDSILKNQMDTLEDQATVSDRILALNKALQAEGYKGLSQLDIATIKTEELKGKIQAGLTELGTSALPVVEDIVDGLNKADESTGGLSTKALTIGGIVTAMAAPAILVAQKLHEAYKWAKDTINLGEIAKSKYFSTALKITVEVSTIYAIHEVFKFADTHINTDKKRKALAKKMHDDFLEATKEPIEVEGEVKVNASVKTKFNDFKLDIKKAIQDIRSFLSKNPISEFISGEPMQFGFDAALFMKDLKVEFDKDDVQKRLDEKQENNLQWEISPDFKIDLSSLQDNGGVVGLISDYFKNATSDTKIDVPLSLGLTFGDALGKNTIGSGFNINTFVSDIKGMMTEYFVNNVMTFDIPVTPGFNVNLTQFNDIKTQISDGWNTLKSTLSGPIIGTVKILTGPIVNINTVIDLYNLVTGGSIGHVTINDDGSISFTKSKVEDTYNTTKQNAHGNVSVSAPTLPGVLGVVQQLYTKVTGGSTGNITVGSSSVNTASAKTTNLYSKVKGGSKGNLTVGSGSVTSAQGKTNTLYNKVRKGEQGTVTVKYGTVNSAISSVWSLIGALNSIPRSITTTIHKVVTGGGPAGPTHSIRKSMGSGPFNNLNLNYEPYQGIKKSPFVNGGLSGNCVDMSLGLLALNGGKGSIIQGSWNGGPHVWYQDPSGRNWDPARKALVGSWNPPARGPSETSNTTYYVAQIDMKNATVYGKDDWINQMDKIATNRFYKEMDINQATGH